ncbi:19909_t:CDS:2, partial [Rhizophagus irregularis]
MSQTSYYTKNVAKRFYIIIRDVNGSVHPVFGPKTGGLNIINSDNGESQHTLDNEVDQSKATTPRRLSDVMELQ